MTLQAEASDRDSSPQRLGDDPAVNPTLSARRVADEPAALLGRLSANPFFGNFSEEALGDIVSRFSLVGLSAGELLVEYDEIGCDLFVIEEGTASVLVPIFGCEREVAEVDRGEVLGELSLIRGAPHGARVLAKTDMQVWRFGCEAFFAAMREEPQFSAALLNMLAERLMETTRNFAVLSYAAERLVHDAFDEALLAEVRSQSGTFGAFVRSFEDMARFVTQRTQQLEEEVAERTRSLESEVERRRRAEDGLRKLALTDPLTGASNRRHFFEEGDRELSRARRHGLPVALLALDLDHFKRVNDTYGHPAGDLVLQKVVECIQNQLRESDVLGRLGGEEFGVLAPECPLEAALRLAERLRGAVEKLVVASGQDEIGLTVSIGVVVCDPHNELGPSLDRADRALYEAKAAGRNQVAAG
jgi:diguanylate cyclase (GGDEF)-like protein